MTLLTEILNRFFERKQTIEEPKRILIQETYDPRKSN